jgi:hypothetical protein
MANRLQGALLGMIGGAAGVAAMNWFMGRTAKWVESEPRTTGDGYSMSLVGRTRREDEAPTATVGRVLYQRATGREPEAPVSDKLSTAVHWGYGVLMAGLYGVLRGPRARPDVMGGLVFGAVLWAIGDELALPLLGLAPKPTAFRPSVHVQAAAGHLAYGATTAAATFGLGRLLGGRAEA